MIDPAVKAQTISEFQAKPSDTGSVEVQVALLTKRVTRLTDHLKTNKHDYHTRHGLLKMVSKRNKLLRYLKSKDLNRYRDLIAKLNLRDKF